MSPGLPPEDGDTEDTAAMAALAGGDDAALARLTARWAGRLTAFLTRLTGDPATADDLAQETFVRIFRARSSWRPGARFNPWLFSIAANLARRHHRFRRRHPEILQAEPSLGEVDPAPDPAVAATSAERAAAVRAAVLTLPHDLRAAVILTTWEGMTQADAAEALGVTIKALEHRTAKARELLRRRLASWLETGA